MLDYSSEGMQRIENVHEEGRKQMDRCIRCIERGFYLVEICLENERKDERE